MGVHSMNLPNFFIIGAPKCGTTAMSVYLGRHPEIFISKPKEPHFFATDFPAYQQVTDETNYQNCFREKNGSQKLIGDGSALYLRSEVAVPKIMNRIPHAKFIVMFRNPVDMAYSMHGQAVYDGDEDEPDFEKAWYLQTQRMNGISRPKKCRDHRVLQYSKLCKLGEQSVRLLENVPRLQIYPVFFDEFIAETEPVYRGVCEFLDVDSLQGNCEFEPVNSAKRARSPGLNRFLRAPSPWISSATAKVKQSFGVENIELLRPLRALNRIAPPQKQLSTEFTNVLREHFYKDVRLLEELWDKKTKWCQ